MSTDAREDVQRHSSSDARTRRGQLGLATLAAACIASWSLSALVMLNRGFDVVDEGTYLLSYRWWRTNPYFIPGSQYFYGPIFELLHESIPALRFLRLVMLICAGGSFAWTFCTWLAKQRGVPIPTATRICGVLLITAPSGFEYLYTPLTPGYDDVMADATFVLVALLLATLVRAPEIPLWTGLLAGADSFLLMLTKWPALGVVTLVEGAALAILLTMSRRAALRHALTFVTGLVGVALACQWFLFPVTRVLAVTHELVVASNTGSHSPGTLLGFYAAGTSATLAAAAILALPAVACYAGTWAMHASPAVARPLLAAGALCSGLVLPFAVGWDDGDVPARVVIHGVLALLISATVALVLPRSSQPTGPGHRSKLAETVVLLVLVVVPVGQALGTANPLLIVAAGVLPLWTAAIVLVWTAGRPRLASDFVVVSLSVLLLVIGIACANTIVRHPNRTAGFSADSAPDSALGGVRIPETTEREWDALRAGLRPYFVPGRTPVFAYDEMSGVTYALDGEPVGSTWTYAGDVRVTARTLALACRNGDVDASRPPILLLDHQLAGPVVDALAGCGFDFPGDYRALRIPGGPPLLRVYVPRS
jgi:hypothetical protein